MASPGETVRLNDGHEEGGEGKEILARTFISRHNQLYHNVIAKPPTWAFELLVQLLP